MPATFDFENQPMAPNTLGPVQPIATQQQLPVKKPIPEPDPVITGGGFHFTVTKDGQTGPGTIIEVDNGAVEKAKKTRKRKDPAVSADGIVRAEGTVEETSTLNTYAETAYMLKDTLKQIDTVAAEVKMEFDSIRTNRTMKSKHIVMTNLTENLSDLLNAKISAIRELNNCISKSNDLDYKRERDRKEAAMGVGDDKAIMDLYQAFVQNPMGNNNAAPTLGSGPLGPTPISAVVNDNSGIVRAPADTSSVQSQDTGFVNYLANLTPEQNMMLYEQNPDVKQVVVYDEATNNKWFQVMNLKTMQVVPNMPVHDQMFMNDTTIDKRNKIAKNINLNETYPLIVINESVASEY